MSPYLCSGAVFDLPAVSELSMKIGSNNPKLWKKFNRYHSKYK